MRSRRGVRGRRQARGVPAQGGDQQVLQIPPGETLGGENAGGGAPGFLEQTQQQVFAAYVIMSQALGQGPGGS